MSSRTSQCHSCHSMALLSAVLWSLYVLSPARGGEPLPDMGQIQAKWDEYVRRVVSREGTTSYRIIDRNTGQTLERGGSEMAVHGTNAYSRSTFPVAHQRGRLVYGANQKYLFTLNEDGDSDRYSLTGLTWSAEGPAEPSGLNALVGDRPIPRPDDRFGLIMLDLCRGFVIDNTWFPFVVKSPDFHLEAIEPAGGADSGLVRLRFAWTPKDKMLVRNCAMRGGEVVLDRGNYWLIRTARVAGMHGPDPSKGLMIVENTYRPDVDGLPLIQRSVLRESGTLEDGTRFNADTIYDYDYHAVSSDSEKFFHLAGFGMSEPVRQASPQLHRSRLKWLFVNLGAVILILAAILYYRRSRREVA